MNATPAEQHRHRATRSATSSTAAKSAMTNRPLPVTNPATRRLSCPSCCNGVESNRRRSNCRGGSRVPGVAQTRRLRNVPASCSVSNNCLRKMPMNRRGHHRRARQSPRRCNGRIHGRGVEVVDYACGIPELLKGEYSTQRRPEDRQLVRSSAAWRGRWHHAVQLPGHGADVDVPHGHCLRQHLRAEALRERPDGADARRHEVAARGGTARRRLSISSTATRKRSTRCSMTSACTGRQFRWLDADRRVHLYDRHRQRQARAGARRRKESRHHHARCGRRQCRQCALMGAAFGSCGERCMAISVAVCVGDESATKWSASCRPR